MRHKNTVRIAVPAESVDSLTGKRSIAQAAEVLRAGGIVAFPTETVYGLGANALDATAVEQIFWAKQRPAWDPLIVHVSGTAMLSQAAASVSIRARKLIDAFWPGPLTLLLPKPAAVPDAVTAGRSLVGVRWPAHPVAQALIAAAGVPLAAPSANRFGHTSPTTAQHVLDDLDGRIDLVLDAGPTPRGVESTVIEVREESIILYRFGAIPVKEIEAVAGPVDLYQPPVQPNELWPQASNEPVAPESLPSPGVAIRHYAPNARLIPVEVDAALEGRQYDAWLGAIRRHSLGDIKPGVMLPDGWPLPETFAGEQFAWGSWRDDRVLAQRLFAGLRALDALGATIILCPLPLAEGLGAAIRDRLLKAAREK